MLGGRGVAEAVSVLVQGAHQRGAVQHWGGLRGFWRGPPPATRHRCLSATPCQGCVHLYIESLLYLHVYLYHIVIHLLSNIIYYWLRWVCRGRHLTGPPDLNAGGKI